jgi:thiosulfate/3-mercaptopyruvate sulfurtransferase
MLAHVRRFVVIASVVTTAGAAGAQPADPEGLLITPSQLARQLGNPKTVVLHVSAREDYDAGHIAGARFVELRDLSAPRQEGGLALELPDEATLRQRLERLGIADGSTVVVAFGADWVSPATRVVFTLQAAGLGSRTRFLDGGTAAWKRAGHPLTIEAPPAVVPGTLTEPAQRPLVVNYEWVQANARAPGVRLIDARAPMFFQGPGMRDHGAGHIAGATNIPFNSLVDDSLRILPTEELRRKFAAGGVLPGDTVAAYCHIGQQATVVLLAARLLGHRVLLYDGSMDDWEKRGLPLVNPTRGQGGGGPPPDGTR